MNRRSFFGLFAAMPFMPRLAKAVTWSTPVNENCMAIERMGGWVKLGVCDGSKFHDALYPRLGVRDTALPDGHIEWIDSDIYWTWG